MCRSCSFNLFEEVDIGVLLGDTGRGACLLCVAGGGRGGKGLTNCAAGCRLANVEIFAVCRQHEGTVIEPDDGVELM